MCHLNKAKVEIDEIRANNVLLVIVHEQFTI